MQRGKSSKPNYSIGYEKELIYSDRYVKLSADGQIIEGNNGFHSDQNLNHPVFENISGSIEVEKQQRKQ